jgi:hypothetical protein
VPSSIVGESAGIFSSMAMVYPAPVGRFNADA